MQGNNIRGPAAEALGKMLRHNKSILRYFVALNVKAPITNAADDILKDFFFNFSKKTSFDISCESSAWQTIHMKYQDLFSLKN